MPARIISARYSGTCRTCPNPIAEGQPVEVEPGLRGVKCMACVDPQRHAQTRKDGTKAPVPTGKGTKLLRTYEQLFPDD